VVAAYNNDLNNSSAFSADQTPHSQLCLCRSLQADPCLIAAQHRTRVLVFGYNAFKPKAADINCMPSHKLQEQKRFALSQVAPEVVIEMLRRASTAFS